MKPLTMLNDLLELYRQRFGYRQFYDKLTYYRAQWPEDHASNANFLEDYPYDYDETTVFEEVLTKTSDIRVDLPIWFGSPNARNRIMVIGMEPRDTNEKGRYNIERCDSYVFGTPFALERKDGVYHTAFKPLLAATDLFVYFTDVVKTYDIVEKCNKVMNDHHAREVFEERAKEYSSLLLAEMQLIKPKLIIALGNISFKVLCRHLPENSPIKQIRHPAYGGAMKASEQLTTVIANLHHSACAGPAKSHPEPAPAALTFTVFEKRNTEPFQSIRPYNLQNTYLKQPAIPAVYVWGYQEPGKRFVPLYVGKTRNVAERVMQHFCRFKGGEYRIFDKKQLDAIYYENQPLTNLSSIYTPDSFQSMMNLAMTGSTDHQQMIQYFVMYYVPVPDLLDRIAGERYLADQLNRSYLLSFVTNIAGNPSPSVMESIDYMAQILKA